MLEEQQHYPLHSLFLAGKSDKKAKWRIALTILFCAYCEQRAKTKDKNSTGQKDANLPKANFTMRFLKQKSFCKNVFPHLSALPDLYFVP